MNKTKKILLTRLALLALGAGLMVFGIIRGEAAVVLQKAVSICMECIGIG